MGALLVDMLLVMTMVENGLCYWEQMQQISSEILWVIRSKYVGLFVLEIPWWRRHRIATITQSLCAEEACYLSKVIGTSLIMVGRPLIS